MDAQAIDELTINTIRLLAVDGVQRANSGHPGLPMGAAAMAYVLFTRFLTHSPQDPQWINRDRFILSAGHGSMLLYALLHLTGYDLPIEELRRFRQWGSKTPGHPEHGLTPGVETTTGPLGQGFANGVGMAIAERFLSARFNRPGFSVIDHHTYAIVSDGDLMEGITHEAASLAGHLGLGKLIYLYDDNEISIDGSTDLSFTEDVDKRFEAYSWHVQHVADGNDNSAVDTALRAAVAETDKPSLIRVQTVIGFGSPNKQGTEKAHGSPLGADEVAATKRNLGWPEDCEFHVPEAVSAHLDARTEGDARQKAHQRLLDRYQAAHPDLAKELEAWMSGQLSAGWEEAIPTFEVGSTLATRAASGKVLDGIVPALGNLIGGSADLTPSNKTQARSQTNFQKATPDGSYLRFGVREHAMAAVSNGIALHGGLRPYCGTFLIFSDYLRPSLRLSALMELPVVFVFTHDSIGLGEDGPTHQAVEHCMALRAIPNLTVIRPADAAETAEAWRVALTRTGGPTALALTRQGVPTLSANATDLRKGAYILEDCERLPELLLLASGSEVHLVQGAARELRMDGVRVRVVSMPSWELFSQQPQAYRERVLPGAVSKRLAVEAGITLGWERYVGTHGRVLGLDRFGASAPGSVLFEQFGFTVQQVVKAARAILA